MNYLVADTTTGADYIVLDSVQGAAGPPSNLVQYPVVTWTGPTSGTVALYSINEVVSAGGIVTLTFPAGSLGAWAIISVIDDPSGHNFTLNPYAGKQIEGVLGVGASLPGTYYSSLVYASAGLAGEVNTFYVRANGNFKAW